MNATINTPCSCPEQWPARECTRHDERPESYQAPLPLRVIGALGFCVLATNVFLLGRLAWNAVRGLLGG